MSADAAVAALRAGEPIVLPTDTVYGLCATPHSSPPVERMYKLKGRDRFHPTALVASDIDTLLECVPELDERDAILRALLPGPYTLVLANPGRRFHWLTGNRPETIGVRVPALEGDAADIVRSVGVIAATSANLAGGLDPRRVEDVPEEIRNGCGAVIDGGTLPGIPSTVVDLTGATPSVLREGAVRADEVHARLAELGL